MVILKDVSKDEVDAILKKLEEVSAKVSKS